MECDRRGPAAPITKVVKEKTPPARLAVHDLDDLIDLIPCLMGFHPQESLVVLVLEFGRVALTARVDLLPMSQPAALAELLGRVRHRFVEAEIWLLGYSPDPDLAWQVLDTAADILGPEVLGRAVWVGPSDYQADSAEGPRLSHSNQVSALRAQATVLGLQVRASREELNQLVAGPPSKEMMVLERVFEDELSLIIGEDPGEWQQIVSRLCELPERADRQTARLALLVETPPGLREVLVSLDRESCDAQLRLWSEVVSRTPPRFAAGALGLMGLAAWLTGDGALQVICLDRLEAIGGEPGLTGLLSWLNLEVVPPAHWERVRAPIVQLLDEDMAELLQIYPDAG